MHVLDESQRDEGSRKYASSDSLMSLVDLRWLWAADASLGVLGILLLVARLGDGGSAWGG